GFRGRIELIEQADPPNNTNRQDCLVRVVCPGGSLFVCLSIWKISRPRRMIAQIDSGKCLHGGKMQRFLLPLLLVLLFPALCAAQEKKKIAYSVFVDNSGSMRSQFEKVIQISKAVVHQIHEHGPVSIFDFHSQGKPGEALAVPILRIEQVQDEDLLEQCIEDLYVEGGQTTLLDALEAMADHLA